MQLKNTNKYSGYRQLTSGYITVPRRFIIENFKNNDLSVTDLGYYLITVLSADWDETPNRKGCIRMTNKDMASAWGINESGISKTLSKLLHKTSIFTSKGKSILINDFRVYTPRGAEEYIKEKVTDSWLDEFFNIPESSIQKNKSQIPKSKSLQAELPNSFRSSFKDSNLERYPKKVRIKQEIRTKEEYQRLSIEGNGHLPTIDEMKWIDTHIYEDQEITDRQMEKDIINDFFNGDEKEYKRNLINNVSR